MGNDNVEYSYVLYEERRARQAVGLFCSSRSLFTLFPHLNPPCLLSKGLYPNRHTDPFIVSGLFSFACPLVCLSYGCIEVVDCVVFVCIFFFFNWATLAFVLLFYFVRLPITPPSVLPFLLVSSPAPVHSSLLLFLSYSLPLSPVFPRSHTLSHHSHPLTSNPTNPQTHYFCFVLLYQSTDVRFVNVQFGFANSDPRIFFRYILDHCFLYSPNSLTHPLLDVTKPHSASLHSLHPLLSPILSICKGILSTVSLLPSPQLLLQLQFQRQQEQLQHKQQPPHMDHLEVVAVAAAASATTTTTNPYIQINSHGSAQVSGSIQDEISLKKRVVWSRSGSSSSPKNSINHQPGNDAPLTVL